MDWREDAEAMLCYLVDLTYYKDEKDAVSRILKVRQEMLRFISAIRERKIEELKFGIT